MLRSHYAVNVDQVRRARPRSPRRTGSASSTPLHATSSGKVLLAHLRPTQRRLLDAAGLPGSHRHTITSRPALETELAAARDDGYATTVEEYEDGLNAVAAPVRDHSGSRGRRGQRLRAGLPARPPSGCASGAGCWSRRPTDQPPDGLPG